MTELLGLTEAIKSGDRMQATRVTEQAIESGKAPRRILDALVRGMDDVGQRFKCHEIYLPDVLIAARAMKESMILLEPQLAAAGISPRHTVVIGTVQGDLHDIGKNLVAILWRGAGFGVVDLGTNVSPQLFVEAAREHAAALIGLSALLTTTMPAMKTTIDVIQAAGLHPVKVMVGGAPVTCDFARRIGADGYAPDAATAVDAARQLLAA